jgi:glutamine amidotransferase-like uncharacterized protein
LRAAVYVGAGASHSWMWFADLLERLGIYDTSFIEERAIVDGKIAGYDLLLIGGGDTYAMAGALGPEGAGRVEEFVRGGGFYLGSCAGAYLVLSAVDLEPFTPFALVEGGMLNVMPQPPEPRCMAHKYLAPYGGQWVFNPVYGEVELEPGSDSVEFECFRPCGSLRTALFGGPVMQAADRRCVVARFAGLSDRAAYPWPREEAASFMTGKPAVLSAPLGHGVAVASGPHLEHPHHPGGNALAAELVLRHCRFRFGEGADEPGSGVRSSVGLMEASDRDSAELLHEIKRQVSNARIVAFGMETLPVTWLIGVKVWEPEKIRMFLECAWSRLAYLQEHAGALNGRAELAALARGYESVTGLTRSLKTRIESGEDSLTQATLLLNKLKGLTARFLSLYFQVRLIESAQQVHGGDLRFCRGRRADPD